MARSSNFDSGMLGSLTSVFEQGVELLTAMYDELYPDKTQKMPRLFHNKGETAEGFLEIGDDVPADLQHGVFAKRGSHPVYVRFSNGSTAHGDDSKPDVHGVAIKVMFVMSEDLSITQDFVMGNYPTFFVRNAVDMVEFIKSTKEKKPLNFFMPGWNPLRWRLSEFFNLLGCLMRRVRNPLAEQYWSQTPYKLAKLEVKLSLKPAQDKTYVSSKLGRNLLRENMIAHLSENDASFDLLVQVRTDPDLEPINDPTVEWISPMRKVGTIILPKQTFDIEQSDCLGEFLRFSPWNTLPEHSPLGDINLMRNPVYKQMSAKRLERNGA